jgi:GNAT superfamily N-acetyltransferase
MDPDIRIRVVGRRECNLLSAMYARFDPLGAAFGLPPHAAEVRRSWIGHALSQKLNVAAFSPEGSIVCHCFLVADNSVSAELAVFVDQECRRRGIGTALVNTALQWAAAVGLRRIWSMTSSENRVAVRLQWSCGFRPVTVSTETELEVYLPRWTGVSGVSRSENATTEKENL